MSKLRSYARMAAQSQKVKDGADAFAAVYAEVDARSEGRCEVTMRGLVVAPMCGCGLTPAHSLADVHRHPESYRRRADLLARCERRAEDHHHLYRPRRSNHTAEQVVHICRRCHDRTEWPYKRGRLCFVGRAAGAFLFEILAAASKFQARGQGE